MWESPCRCARLCSLFPCYRGWLENFQPISGNSMSHMSGLMQSEKGWGGKSLSWFPINWDVRETYTCQFQTEQSEAMAVSKIVLGFIFLKVHLVIGRWSKLFDIYQYYFPQVALAASNRNYKGPYSERAPSFVTPTRAEQPRDCKWRLSFEKIITWIQYF